MMKTLFHKILPFLGITEGSMDVLGLILRSKEIQEKLKGIFEGLPEETKARFNRNATKRSFVEIYAKLDPKERDAIDEIMARLDSDQLRQERFITKTVLTGGSEIQPSVDFLKVLATKDTDDALRFLERVDYTTTPDTKGWFQAVLGSTPKAIADTVKEFWHLFKDGCRDLSVDFDNTGLPATAKTLRDKAKTWSGL